MKEPGERSSAFRAVPRRLNNARWLGVSQEQVEQDAVVDPDDPWEGSDTDEGSERGTNAQSGTSAESGPGSEAASGSESGGSRASTAFRMHVRQPTGEVRPESRRASQVAQSLNSVLSQFLVTPEWAAGLKLIRDKATARLNQGLDEPDSLLVEGVEFFLSERSFMRRWGDITAAGAVSQLITGSSGRRARLIVRSELRRVRPSTIDDVPVKEETQRFLNVVDQRQQGGSVSLALPSASAGYTIGNPLTTEGGHSSLLGQVQASGTLSADRGHLVNTGSGDIRGLVLHGNSVRYLTEMHLTVQLAMDGFTPDAMPSVDGGIVVGLRVPEIQRQRFEALIDSAVRGVQPLIQLVDDEPDAQRSERHPPETIARGAGMGFSGVGHLHGAELVQPAIVRLVRRADAPMAWAQPWSALDEADLTAQLSGRFSREALTSGAAALFQPSGVSMDFFRPAKEGSEIIQVTVRASRGVSPVPTAAGRIDSATLEVMPSAFAGNSAQDVVGTYIGVSAQATGSVGLGISGPPRTLGVSGQLGASRAHSASTGVQTSGFGLEAMLYEGPARYFDYGVSFHISVTVTHEPGTVPTDWIRVGLSRFARFVRALTGVLAEYAVAMTGQAIPLGRAGAAQVARTATLQRELPDGSVRFVVPEMFTRTVPPDIAGPPALTQTRRFQSLPPAPGRAPMRRDITLPGVERFLGPDGHVPLNPDDQLMEILVGGHGHQDPTSMTLGHTLRSLLREAGVSPLVSGDLPATITTPEHLGSSMVRGPSVLMTTVVQDRFVADLHAEIRIEGYPTNVREAGSGPVRMFQMHVAEGDGTLSSAVTRGYTISYAFEVLFGLLVGGARRTIAASEPVVRPGQAARPHQDPHDGDHADLGSAHPGGAGVPGVLRRHGLAHQRDHPSREHGVRRPADATRGDCHHSSRHQFPAPGGSCARPPGRVRLALQAWHHSGSPPGRRRPGAARSAGTETGCLADPCPAGPPPAAPGWCPWFRWCRRPPHQSGSCRHRQDRTQTVRPGLPARETPCSTRCETCWPSTRPNCSRRTGQSITPRRGGWSQPGCRTYSTSALSPC